MKIAILGGGAREFALGRNFLKHGHQVVGVPGNAGFRYFGMDTHPYQGAENFAGYFEIEKFDLAVAGQEAYLKEGIGDVMHDRGLPFFGPRRAHARAEWDKGYLHELLKGTGLMPDGKVFRSRTKAIEFLERNWKYGRMVGKSTSLREGKGVIVEDNFSQMLAGVDSIMRPPPLGWGDDILFQEKLYGPEISTMTLAGKGMQLVNLPSSKDNKAVGENGFGLNPKRNTGGMGAESPHPHVGQEEFDRLLETHTKPLIEAVRDDAGCGDVIGAVYNGMMRKTVEGPVLILESNLGRFGDPEIEAVLMRLAGNDMARYFKAAVDGSLGELPPLVVDPRTAVMGFLCTPGYPTAGYKDNIGKALRGLEHLQGEEAVPFLAGVRDEGGNPTSDTHTGNSSEFTAVRRSLPVRSEGSLVNFGGRVLGVGVFGDNREEARERFYSEIDGGNRIGIGEGRADTQFRADLFLD